MEYYTLDDQLRRDVVIEGYQSFIWTERYYDVGDFQIVMKSTLAARKLLAPETRITRNGSTYIGKVDTVSDTTDSTGVRNLTIIGKFMEQLLDDRVAFGVIGDTTVNPSWNLTGTPGNIVRSAFQQICVDTILDEHDTIPFYHSGTLLPAGSIAEEADEITVQATPDTLLNFVRQVCQTYFLGFRFVRNGEAGEIYFEVYTGNDLTADQVTRNPVIFDPNMENLVDTSLLQSTANVKTVAYVFAQNGSAIVFAVGGDISASGSDRRVMVINSSNTGDAGEELDAALSQEGVLALSQQKLIYAFDGELPQMIPYVYGKDYNLGDLVEERTEEGFGNELIVTEQTFAADSTGEKTFPTLTIKQVVTPGTWFVEDPDLTWDEVPEDVIWATL